MLQRFLAALSLGVLAAGCGGSENSVLSFEQEAFHQEALVEYLGYDPFFNFPPLDTDFNKVDVWLVDWEVSEDPNSAYASDLDEGLASLGFISEAVTKEVVRAGLEPEEAILARALVEKRTLEWIRRYYGDLAIAFIRPSGFRPEEKDLLRRSSSICVSYGEKPGVVGTALTDMINIRYERDCGKISGDLRLGGFINMLAPVFKASFRPYQGAGLWEDSVAARDVEWLRMLFDEGAFDSEFGMTERFLLLKRQFDSFGKILGLVLAHEIGHSVGLDHTNKYEEGESAYDIMQAAITVSMTADYYFVPAHWEILEVNLPGHRR